MNGTGLSITVTGVTTFTYASVAANSGPFANQGVSVKTGGSGYFSEGPMVDNLYAQFLTTDQNIVSSVYSDRDAYRRSHQNYCNVLKRYATVILQQQVNEDFRLTSYTISAALLQLVNEMIGAAQTVKASVASVGAQTAYTGITNVGNVVIVGSINAGNGKVQEYLIPETVSFTCTADSVTGGTTANQERWTAQGQNAQFDQLSWDWPGGSPGAAPSGVSTALPYGSGGSAQLTVVDATLNNAGGNVLVNSGFETFTTTNVPDNWTVLAGTAGTDFAKDTTIPYSGLADLKIIGGTGTGASLAQVFNTAPTPTLNAGGTGYKIQSFPDQNYAVNLFIKADVVPASGVVTVDLVDGTNTPINDDAGAANSFTITLSGISTSYVAKNGIFRLPVNPSAVVKLRIRASTVVPGGSNIFIDHVAMTPLAGLNGSTLPYYGGGAQFAIFSGNTKPRVGDAYTIATVNVAGGFQRLFQRFFGIVGLGMQLPSSGAPTILDSLIG
jgi:hypothetical protein